MLHFNLNPFANKVYSHTDPVTIGAEQTKNTERTTSSLCSSIFSKIASTVSATSSALSAMRSMKIETITGAIQSTGNLVGEVLVGTYEIITDLTKLVTVLTSVMATEMITAGASIGMANGLRKVSLKNAIVHPPTKMSGEKQEFIQRFFPLFLGSFLGRQVSKKIIASDDKGFKEAQVNPALIQKNQEKKEQIYKLIAAHLHKINTPHNLAQVGETLLNEFSKVLDVLSEALDPALTLVTPDGVQSTLLQKLGPYPSLADFKKLTYRKIKKNLLDLIIKEKNILIPMIPTIVKQGEPSLLNSFKNSFIKTAIKVVPEAGKLLFDVDIEKRVIHSLYQSLIDLGSTIKTPSFIKTETDATGLEKIHITPPLMPGIHLNVTQAQKNNVLAICKACAEIVYLHLIDKISETVAKLDLSGNSSPGTPVQPIQQHWDRFIESLVCTLNNSALEINRHLEKESFLGKSTLLTEIALVNLNPLSLLKYIEIDKIIPQLSQELNAAIDR